MRRSTSAYMDVAPISKRVELEKGDGDTFFVHIPARTVRMRLRKPGEGAIEQACNEIVSGANSSPAPAANSALPKACTGADRLLRDFLAAPGRFALPFKDGAVLQWLRNSGADTAAEGFCTVEEHVDVPVSTPEQLKNHVPHSQRVEVLIEGLKVAQFLGDTAAVKIAADMLQDAIEASYPHAPCPAISTEPLHSELEGILEAAEPLSSISAAILRSTAGDSIVALLRKLPRRLHRQALVATGHLPSDDDLLLRKSVKVIIDGQWTRCDNQLAPESIAGCQELSVSLISRDSFPFKLLAPKLQAAPTATAAGRCYACRCGGSIYLKNHPGRSNCHNCGYKFPAQEAECSLCKSRCPRVPCDPVPRTLGEWTWLTPTLSSLSFDMATVNEGGDEHVFAHIATCTLLLSLSLTLPAHLMADEAGQEACFKALEFLQKLHVVGDQPPCGVRHLRCLRELTIHCPPAPLPELPTALRLLHLVQRAPSQSAVLTHNLNCLAAVSTLHDLTLECPTAMTNEEAAALHKCFSQLSSLTSLTLCPPLEASQSPECVAAALSVMVNTAPQLQRLCCDGLSVREGLCANMLPKITALRHLSLRGCGLVGSDAVSWSTALGGLRDLRKLDLSENGWSARQKCSVFPVLLRLAEEEKLESFEM